jgi:Zn-dependent peptidase ImmA (M78 family)
LGFVVVAVVFGRLPEGVHGYTDGERIYVDDRLSAVQLLCTLTHELIHVELGHGTKQLEAVEMAVRYETARRLLPQERIGSCNKSGKLSEIAKGLGVTKRVLMDRAATLTDSDASKAGCWDCQKCPAIAMRATRMVAELN